MNRETERYGLAGGAAVIVALFAIWKGVGVAPAVLAILVTGAVFIGVEYVLDQRQMLPDTVPAPGGESRVAFPAAAAPPTVSEGGQEISSPNVLPNDGRTSATLDMALLDPNSVEVTHVASAGTRTIWSLSIAKHGQAIAECEDAVHIDATRWVMAVADGASSSFGAGRWAQVLVDEFVTAPPQPLSPGSFDSWLERSRAAMSGGESADRSGWWAEEGARRGAFATLVGAAVHGKADERVATVMCLGDSCAFLVGGDRRLRRSLPYEDASQFGSHPSLIGSLPGHGAVAPSWTTLPVAPGDVLVLASDAVSEWLLGDQRRIDRILELTPSEIADVVIAERAVGHIVNDDLTLAVMGLS
jgi:serine/threonine protein phosphatase PrpC